MWKHSNSLQPSHVTREDGVTIWWARDVYRARHAVRSLIHTFLALEGVALVGMGLWWTALLVVGLQCLALCGGIWVLRRAGQWGRTWWRHLVLALLLSATLPGCEPMAREVAKLHGVNVDPFPGPCAPESFQAGTCVAVKQGGRQ